MSRLKRERNEHPPGEATWCRIGPAARLATAAIMITSGLTLSASPAQALACKNPWQIAQEIDAVITGGAPLEACNWRAQLDDWDTDANRWGFVCWRDGCSQNLPLLAAAVAVMHQPIQGGQDMRRWFLIFLKAQLGQSVPEQSVPANLKFFKGTEMLSPVYDGWSTMAVMSVYYWASRMQPNAPFAADIRARADNYLRATFYLWGLSAGKNTVAAQYKNDSWFAGANTKERHPVTTAGPRAGVAELTNSRSWLFAKVSGLSSDPWRPASLKNLYDTMHSNWPAVHGLSATQQGYLRNLVQQNQLPPNFNAVVTGLKMIRNMHFVIWNGDRLSFLEGSTPNTNKGAVFAQSYYFHPFKTTSGKEVHFLYPFFGAGIGQNGTLTIDAAASRLEATGQFTAYLSIPTARPIRYHLRLGPGGLTHCNTLTC